MRHVELIADGVIAAVKAHVAGAVGAVSKRMDGWEAKLAAIPAGPPGPQGVPGESIKGEQGVQGERGESVKGEKGDKGDPGERGPAGEVGPPGADGVPGNDGRNGIDGTPGRDGRDGLPGLAGKDGANGVDGKDGFSLEDFDIALSEDGRTLSLKFARGEVLVERSIRLATMIYRGVWAEGDHEPGDVVTWGGSAWHCQEKTMDKPGISAAWKMMVKEGRPGKDGKSFDAPPRSAVVHTK